MNESTTVLEQATSAAARGTFKPYSSDLPVTEVPGYRSLAINYKQTAAMKKAGKEARASVYCYLETSSITTDTIKESIETLAPYILQLIHREQDELVKTYHREGGCTLYSSNYSLDKVLASWEDKGASGIDTESVTAFFTSQVAEPISLILLEKLTGTADSEPSEQEAAQIQRVVDGYLSSFVSLASAKTKLPEPIRAKLRKCLAMAGSSATAHPVAKRIISRLDAMDKAELEAMSALGAELDL